MAQNIDIWTGSFNDVTEEDQLAVARLVVNGKAVLGSVENLLVRLKRTRCVALLRKSGSNRIIGAAALKQPGTTYRREVFVKSGAAIAGYEAAPELGYVVIAADMQGKQLSGGLVSVIAGRITEPTFATTDSNTMRNNLERSSFTRVGGEWRGDKGMLSLWTTTP